MLKKLKSYKIILNAFKLDYIKIIDVKNRPYYNDKITIQLIKYKIIDLLLLTLILNIVFFSVFIYNFKNMFKLKNLKFYSILIFNDI